MPTTTYPIDPTVWETARQLAKARALTHWTNWTADKKSANMWVTYNSSLNTDWVDPWFEHETYGIYNDADTNWEQTQNAYMMYCWLSWKGYNPYSQAAMIASGTHESTLTGGVWEAGNHPYGSLVGFDATSYNLYGVPANPDYMINWARVWRNASGQYVPYMPSMIDGATGQSVSLNCSGTWAAIKRYPLKRQTVQIEPGVEVIRPVYNNDGDPTLDTSSPANLNAGNGYGLVQFTPWTKLPRTCAHAYQTGQIRFFNEANRHWQLNLTLQLMVWEYERQVSMTYRPQSGSGYMGQWVDSNAAQQNDMGAYFQWPYNPSQSTNRQYYGQSISWDDFAEGTYLDWVDQKIATMQNPPVTDDDKDWCRRQMALAIWRACFIQTTYADFGFREKTEYFLKAINYWDDNGGFSVMDIPRARDIPDCELDEFHLPTEVLISYKRRDKKRVRTILF